MAVGSIASPVRFANPFRRITEVHWRDRETEPALAFAFIVRLGAVATSDTEVAPAYYSPFGNPSNPFYPGASVPTNWGGFSYFESEGWVSSPAYSITGLPPVGAGPSYAIGSAVPLTAFPHALSMVWVEPSGASLGFETPVAAQEAGPRTFMAGPVSVEGAGGEPSLTFSTSIAAHASGRDFEYAGATTLFRNTNEPQNALVDNRELVILCLPVTA